MFFKIILGAVQNRVSLVLVVPGIPTFQKRAMSLYLCKYPKDVYLKYFSTLLLPTMHIYIHESNFAKFWVVPRNVQVHFIVNRETSVQIIFNVFEASCYRATVTTCIKNVNNYQ